MHAHPHHFIGGEPARVHAKLHKKICIELPAENEEIREALRSLAVIRRYALRTEDKQKQSDIWLTLQSRHVGMLLSLCV